MKWPTGREADQAFGPRFPDEFDFTLRFEHLILTILPMLVYILMALWYMRHLYRRPVCCRFGGPSWVQFVFLGALISIELASLGLWCSPTFRSSSAVGAAVISCIAMLVLAFTISTEHRRSLQPSALTGMYLLLSTLLDIVKTRSYFLRTMGALAGLSTASAAFKFALLSLLEVPKRKRDIVDESLRTTIGNEALAGFWSRTFFVWLNPLFILGSRSHITVEDLSSLGPEFSSEVLFHRLEKSWNKVDNESNDALLKACFATFYVEFFSVVPPRLCYTGFVIAQPLYLRRVVSFIGEANPSVLVRAGLIISCVLIFLGLAASRALYKHMNYRLVTMVRGALIPRVWSKTLAIPYSVAKESAASTLMSTDIEGISAGIADFHEVWASVIEVALGLYLLSTIISQATFFVVLPVLAAFVATYIIGKLYAKGLGAWNAKIEERVSLTTKVLLQIKGIKIIGLESVVSKQIKSSRLAEIDSFKGVRVISGAIVAISVFTETTAPMLAIAGGLFWTTFNGRLTAVNAFTTLAIVGIVTGPLVQILRAYPRLKGIEVCFTRIQKYFLLGEVRSRHAGPACAPPSSYAPATGAEPNIEKTPGQSATNSVLEFKDVHVAPSANADAVLKDVTFDIKPSHFTVVLGSVGSGKTTLLRAVLDEATIIRGEVRRNQRGNFAYCGQKPWLRNISIRSNIIANNPFDGIWYDEVIKACCLEEDLQQLGGDESPAGSNGVNLSGGQKHRVALARAIYSREPTLLLDDVFRGFDINMSQDIYSRLFGASGLLRRLATTVIFATHSVDFLKSADQALMLDECGGVTTETNPSQITLTSDFVAKLQRQEQAGNKEKGTELDTESAPVLHQKIHVEDDLASRSKGDVSLYKYFFSTVSKWKFGLWALTVPLLVSAEKLPEVFIRIWLEIDPTNNKYFGVFAAIGGVGFLITSASSWIYFLNLIPDNGVKLHSNLLDSAVGAKLSFLTSSDIGSIINRFSQDMTILTQQLPIAFYSAFYLATYVLFTFGVVVSGAQYTALMVPLIIIVFYILQRYYLFTSRQMRYLDIEAKAPLYTLFTETSTPNALEHIRAFGWQPSFTRESMHALDYSQRPFYYMYAIQRWLELSMDLIGLFTALILICITTFFQQTTSQAALGLSMLGLITFSSEVNVFLGSWTRLETSLGAIARLRAFVTNTPQEWHNEAAEENGALLPREWPGSGRIQLSNVNARYNTTGAQALDNVSLSVEPGQKVGITGRSGSGKTSLILTLLGLLDSTGRVEIDGIDISSVPKRLLRSHITTIAQDAVQLEGSVRENLVPYEGQADDGKMDSTVLLRALNRVGLSEVISSKGGLDASLSGLGLSEGQLQLLSLARAMLHNQWTGSKVVLMDEPTSSMDTNLDERIQALVRDVFDGCTILMVSHRPGAISDVDVHLEVINGKVARRAAEPAETPEDPMDEP